MIVRLFELVNFFYQTKTQQAIFGTNYVTYKLTEEEDCSYDPAINDSSSGRASDCGSKRPGFEALWKFGADKRCVNNEF